MIDWRNQNTYRLLNDLGAPLKGFLPTIISCPSTSLSLSLLSKQLGKDLAIVDALSNTRKLLTYRKFIRAVQYA